MTISTVTEGACGGRSSMASTDRSSGAWVRIAFAIFAVGSGALTDSSASSRSRGRRRSAGEANGVAVQPLARRMRDMLSGSVAALGCATAGAAIGVAAVAGANRVRGQRCRRASWPGLRPVPGLGAAAGRAPGGPSRARRRDRLLLRPDPSRFRSVACLVDGLGALAGRARCVHRADRDHRRIGRLWTTGYAACLLRATRRDTEADALVSWSRGNRDSGSRLGRTPVRSS